MDKNSTTKFILLSLGGFFAGLLFWWFTKMSFNLGFVEEVDSVMLWKPLGALLFFCLNLAWLGVVGAVIENRAKLALFVAVSQLGYLLFFAGNILGALGYLALFSVGWFWAYRIKKDLKNRIKPVIARSLNFGMHFAVSIFLLVVAFGFYWQAQATVSNQVMMEKLENLEVRLAERVLSTQIKDFDSEMSFENFVYSAASNGFIGRSLVGGLRPEQISPFVLEQIRKNYAQRYEIDLSLQNNVGVILRKVIHSNLTVVLEKYSRFFPFALAIVLFLALKVFGVLYYILIKVFALAFYHALKGLGVLVIRKESMEVERVEL